MKNIANIKENRLIIKKANTISIIYNCTTYEDFQQILNMNDTRLLKDLAINNISQIDADYINIFTIIGNGDILKIWVLGVNDDIIDYAQTEVDGIINNYIKNSYKHLY